MNHKRKRRLYLIFSIMTAVALAVGLTLYALKQNINLFYTPSQIVAGEAPKNHLFRLGGLVQRGSLQRADNTLQVTFILTDMKNAVTVRYTGILPDLFREGQGVVAEGNLNEQGIFIANQVLAKHDEKYMPPPLANALKNTENST